MAVKRYPFNVERYAHDIAFRRNRAINERGELEAKRELNEKEKADLAALEKLIEALGDLLLAFMDRNERGIVWLTGPEIGLAKESCAWAAAERR